MLVFGKKTAFERGPTNSREWELILPATASSSATGSGLSGASTVVKRIQTLFNSAAGVGVGGMPSFAPPQTPTNSGGGGGGGGGSSALTVGSFKGPISSTPGAGALHNPILAYQMQQQQRLAGGKTAIVFGSSLSSAAAAGGGSSRTLTTPVTVATATITQPKTPNTATTPSKAWQFSTQHIASSAVSSGGGGSGGSGGGSLTAALTPSPVKPKKGSSAAPTTTTVAQPIPISQPKSRGGLPPKSTLLANTLPARSFLPPNRPTHDQHDL